MKKIIIFLSMILGVVLASGLVTFAGTNYTHTDTSQTDFSAGTLANTDITTSPGNVMLTTNGSNATVTEGFEQSNLGFGFTGNWARSSSVHHSGSWSYGASTDGTYNPTTSTTVSLSTSGTVTFWYNGSGLFYDSYYGDYEEFDFYIDGVNKISSRSVSSWTQGSFALAAGTHTLTWTLNTSVSYPPSNASTWIDDLSITGLYTYFPSGSYVSPAFDVSSVGSAINGKMSWNGNANGQTLSVQTNLSLDGGSTWGGWQNATNGGAISGIAVNTDLSNARLQYTVNLATSASAVTPILNDITINITAVQPAQTASTLIATDIADNGNGSDMQVRFNGASDETGVGQYRIFVVPSSQVSSFTVSTASGLGSIQYVAVSTSGNNAAHTVVLPSTLQDSTGALIVNGIIYKVFVMSVGQGGYLNALSQGSGDIKLTTLSPVVSQVTNVSANNPNVAKDKLGNIYVTYSSGGHVYIRKSDNLGSSWKYWNGSTFATTGTETYISSGSSPWVVADSNDNVYLIYLNGTVQFSKYSYTLGTWSSPANVESYSATNLSVAADNNNNIYALWMAATGYDASYGTKYSIQFSKYNGTSWSAPANIASNGYVAGVGDSWISIDAKNNINIIYESEGYDISGGPMTANLNVQTYNTSTGASYSNGSVLAVDTDHTIYSPKVMTDSNGVLYAVWTDGNIQFSKFSSGTWSAPTTLASGGSYILAIDGSNNVNMMWNNNNQINLSKYTTSWSSAQGMTLGSYNQSNPFLVQGAWGFVWQGTVNVSFTSSSSSGIMFSTIPEPSPTTAAPGTPTVSDVSNYGDGRDIQVTFTGANQETNIGQYQIYVVQTSQAGAFNATTAAGLAASRYVAEPTNGAGGAHSLTLTQTLLDSAGTAVLNGTSYTIFVLSVGSGGYSSTLSAGSNSLTLQPNVPLPSAGVITTMSGALLDEFNNGDGRDIRIMFKGASSETNIQEYRVIIVRTAIAGSFDVNAASTLTNTSYVLEPTKGKNRLHLFNLTQTLKNSEGNSIVNGTSYTVYVLTVAKTGYSSTLTSLGTITLDANVPFTRVYTPIVRDIGNNNNASDLMVTFKKPSIEGDVQEYRIFVWNTSAPNFNLTQANTNTNYKSEAPGPGNKYGYTIILDSSMTDTRGGANTIQNGQTYEIYILAVMNKASMANILSSPSKQITLSPFVPGVYSARGLYISKAGTGHDSSNIKITFVEPKIVTNITEYRVYIVPSASSLTEQNVVGIPIGPKYQSIAVTGAGVLHSLTLNSGMTAYDGSALAAGNYKVYVLSVGSGGVGSRVSIGSETVALD